MPVRSRRRALEADCAGSCRVLNDIICYKPLTYFHILLAAFHCRRTLLARSLAASTALRLIVYGAVACVVHAAAYHSCSSLSATCVRATRNVAHTNTSVTGGDRSLQYALQFAPYGTIGSCTPTTATHCQWHMLPSPPQPVPSPLRRSAVLQAVAPEPETECVSVGGAPGAGARPVCERLSVVV